MTIGHNFSGISLTELSLDCSKTSLNSHDIKMRVNNFLTHGFWFPLNGTMFLFNLIAELLHVNYFWYNHYQLRANQIVFTSGYDSTIWWHRESLLLFVTERQLFDACHVHRFLLPLFEPSIKSEYGNFSLVSDSVHKTLFHLFGSMWIWLEHWLPQSVCYFVVRFSFSVAVKLIFNHNALIWFDVHHGMWCLIVRREVAIA